VDIAVVTPGRASQDLERLVRAASSLGYEDALGLLDDQSAGHRSSQLVYLLLAVLQVGVDSGIGREWCHGSSSRDDDVD
jgi:hypothetical protein